MAGGSVCKDHENRGSIKGWLVQVQGIFYILSQEDKARESSSWILHG